jgi:hypothetical protein
VAYAVQLIVPPNTLESSPVSAVIPVPSIKVTEVSLLMPEGCVGLVAAWFEYQSVQIWPYNSQDRFRGNGYPIVFRPNLEFTEEPLNITLFAFSTDDTFTHTLYLTMDVDFLKAKGTIDLLEQLTALGPALLEGR